MADSVTEIRECAFSHCFSLIFIKFSINLEFIGEYSFYECDLLNVFIPPKCKEIGNQAFAENENLLIFNVLHRIEFQSWVLYNSKTDRTLTEKEINQQYITELVWECKIFDETNANSDPATGKKRLNALEIVCFVGAFINWLYILFY